MGSLRLMVGSFAAGVFLQAPVGGMQVYLSVCLSVIVLAGDDFFIRADARFPAAILRVL